MMKDFAKGLWNKMFGGRGNKLDARNKKRTDENARHKAEMAALKKTSPWEPNVRQRPATKANYDRVKVRKKRKNQRQMHSIAACRPSY